MANICAIKKFECKSADENGNCTTPMVTKDGLFIVGERWCDGDSVFISNGKTAEQILAEKDESSPSYVALKRMKEFWFGDKSQEEIAEMLKSEIEKLHKA